MRRPGFESRGTAPRMGLSPRGGPPAWASRGSAEINEPQRREDFFRDLIR